MTNKNCKNTIPTLDQIKIASMICSIKDVPINMGIQGRLLCRLRSMRHFFTNTIIAVFQLKHLISKTPYIWRVSKCGRSFLYLQNLLRYCKRIKHIQVLTRSRKNCITSGDFPNVQLSQAETFRRLVYGL